MGVPSFRPNIVGQTTGSVVEDSGVIVSGDLDDSGNAIADVWSINSGPSYGTATVDTNGTWSYDLDDTNATVDALNAGETLTDTFVVRLTSNGTDLETITITIVGVPCFCKGTFIETDTGAVPIENLRAGDLVMTRDHGARPLLWAGNRTISQEVLEVDSRAHPVRIPAGALGGDMPYRDLFVSRQHRMLASSMIAERMFGMSEVLLSAHQLAEFGEIGMDYRAKPVTYYHLLFDQHEIIYAEGAPAESLFIGEDALAPWPQETREQIETLINAAEFSQTARPVPEPKQQEQLIARSQKNGKTLLSRADQFDPFDAEKLRTTVPMKKRLKKAG